MTILTPHSITEMNRLRDQAYVEAHLLRAQAIQDFWRGADHLLLSAALSAERAARRLAARLRRHNPALPCAKTAEELR
jgi:hypothetical protein